MCFLRHLLIFLVTVLYASPTLGDPDKAEENAQVETPTASPAPETLVEAQASPTPLLEEPPVEALTAEEPPPEASPTPPSTLSLLPTVYADLGWQVSLAKLKETSGTSSLTIDSTQLTSLRGTVGGWIPNSSWGLSLSIHSLSFNAPTIPVDKRDARHLNITLDGLYAVMISSDFAFTPWIGVAYRQQPYIFVQNANSTFLTSLTMMNLRLGPKIVFRPDPNSAFNFNSGLFFEYPLTTSSETSFTLQQYQWKIIAGLEGSLAYHLLPRLEAGINGLVMYHSAQLTIAKSGIAAANDRATSWFNVDGGVFLKGSF